jgi:hypothetical protein
MFIKLQHRIWLKPQSWIHTLHAAKPVSNIIFSAVVYGYEKGSFTLREEYRLRVFGNEVLGSIFKPKEGEVTESCKKLYNEELDCVYSSPHIIRVTNQGGWDGQGREMCAGFCGRTGRLESTWKT